MRLALVLCWCLIGATPWTASAEPVRLSPSVAHVNIKERALYRPDPGRTLNAADLLSDGRGFEPYDPALERKAPPLWMKIPVTRPADTTGDYVLLVQSRFFLRFDVYLPDGRGGHERISSGVRNYEPTEKFGHHYVYRFSLDPAENGEILIFADIFQGSLSALDLQLKGKHAFQQHRSVSYWAYGLYFGAMLALVFYNFILYLNLGTPGHRLYVTAMSCVIVLMALNSGLLQGNLPAFAQRFAPLLQIFFNALVAATTARFFQVFVNSRFYIPRMHVVVSALIAVNLLLAFVTFFIPIRFATHLAITVQPVGTITLIVLLVSSLLAGLWGSRSGYVFLAAWSAFSIGTFTWSLLSFNVVQRIPAAEYSLYIGSVMEAMILALGLSYRVGLLRTQRNRAMREQQKAARLANVDPLTGAYNRRFLENYLDGLLDSKGKRAFLGSLIMLDLDHFKEVNDRYGHAAGDAVLRELASRCQKVLRVEDVLARLGGDEFAIVLPDQAGEDAVAVAERIRAAIRSKPLQYDGHAVPIATSIGVVTDFKPGATAYSALKHADQAMYEAKRAGRNQVVVSTGGQEPGPGRMPASP